MSTRDNNPESQSSIQQVADHLTSVLADPVFASSKRCQDFLRYVVSEAVEGRKEELNERNIAQLVFGKNHRFEPSEDSLVRVRAHEVRRRLAQYYRENPDSQMRIELPHGGYAPNFISHAVTDQPPPIQEVQKSPVLTHRLSRRRALWYLGGTAAVATAIPAIMYKSEQHPPSALELLWKPVIDTKTPLLISIPILQSKTANGTISDRVGIGVAEVISAAADFLNAKKVPYRLRFGSGLTFAQLREQPSLLLGGFTSWWSLWATQGLRFNLVAGKQWAQSYIEDSQTKQNWRAENLETDGYATADYAIVARLFDAVTYQVLFVAAGITTFGTEGAASVLFDQRAFSHLLEGAPNDWAARNIEAVVKVSIFGTTPSAPEVVAKHFW